MRSNLNLMNRVENQLIAVGRHDERTGVQQ